MARYVVAVTGASGMVLAYRLLGVLGELGHEIEFVMSSHAQYAASLEMGKEFSSPRKWVEKLGKRVQKNIKIHGPHDVGASICSGSYKTDGMVVIPCSMATLASLAYGLSDNAIRRCGDVTLKERRKLVLVPRETPLSEIHLENMLRLSRMGAVLLPPVPAWYLAPQTLQEVEDYIVGRVLDQFALPHTLYKPYLG